MRFDEFIEKHTDELRDFFKEVMETIDNNKDPEFDPFMYVMSELKNREFGTDIPPSEYEYKLFFVGICSGIALQEQTENQQMIGGILSVLDILRGKK